MNIQTNNLRIDFEMTEISKEKLKKIDWSFLIQTMESNFKTQGLMIYETLYNQLKELQKEIYS